MSSLGPQLKRLGKHSVIYGLGGLVSRVLAVLLLPLYTRYLDAGAYGKVEILIAGSAVLSILLRFGISNAFFRFYFDTPDPAKRIKVLRTSFWFTMTMATAGLVVGIVLAPQISQLLLNSSHEANLVRAAFVGLWAQMNYDQLTALFRVEERSTAFVLASLANILITIGSTLVLVVALHKGPIGVVIGNFIGTLAVYLALLGYRREQLGLEFDRSLFRAMNHFGMPLVPSALLLWVTNFADRFILVKLVDTAEVGLYSLAVRIASAMILLLTAFRTAWPAFAYSIDSEDEAKTTYGFVLTYLVVISTWVATALALLSPWLVRWLAASQFADASQLARASRVVGPLAFSTVAFAGYIVIAIGVGRARRTQFNWVVSGLAAVVNIGLCFALIPSRGMMGAAIATVAAYVVMFLAMTWWSQKVYPVPYQWRRVATAAGVGVALVVIGKLTGTGLALSAALVASYPIALALTGFYLPGERKRLRALVAR